MYKLISVILSLVLILSLSACGGAEAPQAGGANGNAGEKVGGAAAEAEISLTGEIGGEITVSAYDALTYKAFLEDAARLFEKKYPGTTVNVETFSAMPNVKTSEQEGMMLVEYQDDPQGRQDYINKVNTALMSGGGADILAMDVLPFYKYAEARQLENLAAYMQADPEFNKADYRANILEAVEYKNGTWFIPTDYSFNYYAYDSALLTGGAASGFGTGGKFTAEELITLAEPSFDGSSNIFNSPDYVSGPRPDMWSLLLEESYTSFVDIENKTANFDDGGFAALLESVKQYSEQGYIPKGATGQTDSGTIMRQAGEAPTEYLFKLTSNLSLLNHFYREPGISMSEGASGIGPDDEIAGIQANADGSVPFTYNQAYGINSNSGNKETAWAFLKFLMSGEMQLSGGMATRGLPLHNESRSRYIELLLSTAFSQMGQTGPDIPPEVVKQFNEATERFSDQINNWAIKDATVNDMIAAEVRYFFEGAKTAAEVARALQNKADLYLNE